MNNQKVKKIPLGISDYEDIVRDNNYYVDKTKYINDIEDNNGKYIFFLRPRRFGKSLLISTLANYYDVRKKDKFDALFENTYIGENPTPLRNSFYILRFDFSEIGTKDELNIIEDRFNDNIYATIRRFFEVYKDLMGGEQEFERYFPKAVSSPTLISTLLKLLDPKGAKLYVLIDEYDNFANNILMDKGEDDYKKITQLGGFVKDFFKAIKAGTNPAVIDRIFATGVSPLLLSDLTSGMNIGDNVSFDDKLNSLVGFNDTEIEEILEYYINANLVKREDKNEIKRIFKAYYNNYCFSEIYDERVCNSNMVLYFFNAYIKRNKIPSKLLDATFTSDYRKLDFMVYEGKRFGDNYNKLLDIMAYGSVYEGLEETFSLNKINNTKEFISLFYYLGLLTITGKDEARDQFIYEIPNNAVRSMDYEYIANALNRAYELEQGFDSKLTELYFKMATEGEWEAPLKEILDIYYKYVPLRDGVLKEVALKLFCFSFLIRDKYHFATSEKELNRGYSDIYLEADMLFEKTTKYEYIIEFKYIAGGKEEVTKEKVERAKEEATKQLLSYENDRKVLKAKGAGKIVKKIVIVASSQKVELMQEV